MSTISIRLPRSLHKKARDLAKKEQTSINQLVSSALAEKISALTAEEYLQERAKKGSKERFASVLKKVQDREAEERDRL
jgi:predicted transcriptional regulator